MWSRRSSEWPGATGRDGQDPRQTEDGEQFGLVERDDVGDAVVGDGKYLHRVGVVVAVAAAQVAREAGLGVGGDGDQLEVPGLGENPGAEEPPDPVAPGEPGERRRACAR